MVAYMGDFRPMFDDLQDGYLNLDELLPFLRWGWQVYRALVLKPLLRNGFKTLGHFYLPTLGGTNWIVFWDMGVAQ